MKLLKIYKVIKDLKIPKHIEISYGIISKNRNAYLNIYNHNTRKTYSVMEISCKNFNHFLQRTKETLLQVINETAE